jgi:hypothetical protein
LKKKINRKIDTSVLNIYILKRGSIRELLLLLLHYTIDTSTHTHTHKNRQTDRRTLLVKWQVAREHQSFTVTKYIRKKQNRIEQGHRRQRNL